MDQSACTFSRKGNSSKTFLKENRRAFAGVDESLLKTKMPDNQ
jgi:hypothetical protein